MKNLYDIIEECKLNGRPEYDELRYALLAVSCILNLVNGELTELYYKGKMPNEFVRKLKLDGICSMYRNALKKPPKEYLGWNNDPENPEYQKFHKMGSKLVEKALKGELPNQKKKAKGE